MILYISDHKGRNLTQSLTRGCTTKLTSVNQNGWGLLFEGSEFGFKPVPRPRALPLLDCVSLVVFVTFHEMCKQVQWE